ncbi:type IV toxin-antitoxin system AbiEi family antitoxin [Nocardioides sp. LML1-1-1.1]|uniref:type IV toxin-antitoxin system AbiEi family antitoxin n=1 Tax=Nocardioides sp. LML1-1-1.1 TaxID=3135248 RepID=UPI003449C6DA
MSRIDVASDALARLGIDLAVEKGAPPTARFGELVATLTRGRSSAQYVLALGTDLRLDDISRAGRSQHLPVLAASTLVRPRTADGLRRAGIQYVDEAGNAWLEFGDVLIDIRGRRLPKERQQPTTGHRGNLFSAGRSQVIMALLAWPELWSAPTREVSVAAGVSTGLAHDARHLLAGAGFGPSAPSARLDELLEHWTAAFPTGLAQRLSLASFTGDPTVVHTLDHATPLFLSGERAAEDLVEATTLTVYVEDLDHRLPIKNRWRSDGPANIFVRHKFWQSPPGDRPETGVRTAPWPLVYADLCSTGDPRLHAVAEEWKRRHAGPA